MKADLHIHSNYSDGTCSPREILTKARELHLDVISITDHDTISAIPEMLKLDLTGIKFIPGVEISCEARGDSYHMLAYNFQLDKLQEIVSKGNKLGRQKIIDMVGWLDSEKKIHVAPYDVDELLKKESPRKPDLGKLLVKEGYARDLEGAIHEAGGIAVWAHPLRGKCNIIFSEKEFLKRYEHIKEDIDGIEVFYSLFGKQEYEFLEQFAINHKLSISAGSDFHGEHKLVRMAQLNKENDEIDFSRVTILNRLL